MSAILIAGAGCSLFTTIDGLSGAGGSANDGGTGLGDVGTTNAGEAGQGPEAAVVDAGVTNDGSSDARPDGPGDGGTTAVNLLSNGDFEGFPFGGACGHPWFGYQAELTLVTLPAGGGHACRVCASAGGGFAFDMLSVAYRLAAAGQRYRATGRVRATSGAPGVSADLRLYAIAGANVLDAVSGGEIALGASWTTLEVEMTLSDDGLLDLYFPATGPSGVCFEIDDLTLEAL